MKNKITKTILLSAALLFGIFCNTQAQSNIARLIQDGYKMYPYDSPSIAINTLQKYLEESFTTLVFFGGVQGNSAFYTYNHTMDKIGSRTFLVKRNDVFSLERIRAGQFEELQLDCGYVFPVDKIFYLGIYTGTTHQIPDEGLYGDYPDPLLGWIKLKIQEDGTWIMLNSALGYKCKGIIVGTEELIVPTISYQVEGKTMTLTYSDSLYESADGQTWTKVPDAEEGGTYAVDISKSGKKLYCSIMDDAPSR